MNDNHRRGAAVVLLAGIALGALAGSAAAAEKRFVLIVANNRSLTAGVQPLRYADDDGAAYYELFAPGAAHIELLTVFDDDTQRLHRDLAPRVQAPTRAALLARLGDYNTLMDGARKAGDEPVLELVLIGHGEVAADGEGFLSLLDGRFSRHDLYSQVLASSRAAFNHVIIDACNSYLMVARRGADDRAPSAADAIHAYLAVEDLDRYPNTGVIVSTTRARASHEWAAYGGGIFSHELRSALTGAADVNGDGRIEYSEAAAFMAAANLRIDAPEARLDVFVHPPALDRSRALADLATSGYRHFLRVPRSVEGRLHLEDARGLRYADLNKSSERELILGLVDSEYYYLRDEQREVRLPLASTGTLDVDPAALRPSTLATRGTVEESFRRHLFETPFGLGFYHGYIATSGLLAVSDRPQASFAPPRAAADPAALLAAVDALSLRGRDAGLREGDDPFFDRLVTWGRRCARGSDAREIQRVLAVAGVRITAPRLDRASIERKLARAADLIEALPIPERSAAARRLAAARLSYIAGDLAAANRATNELVEAVYAAAPR